jgi:hypothetical protein
MRLGQVGLFIAISLTAAWLGPSATNPGSQQRVTVISQEEAKHLDWLVARIGEALSIKAGMSRADLLKVFEVEGGLQRFPPERYCLRSCVYIKVRVTFRLPKTIPPQSHVEPGKRAELLKSFPDTDWIIETISEPCLGYYIAD